MIDRRLILAGATALAWGTAQADSVYEWGHWAADSVADAIAQGADPSAVLPAPAAGGTGPGALADDPYQGPVSDGMPVADLDPLDVPALPGITFQPVGDAGPIRGQVQWSDNSRIELHLLVVPEQGGRDHVIAMQTHRIADSRVQNIAVTGTPVAGDYYFFSEAFTTETGSTPVDMIVTGDGGATSLSGSEVLRSGPGTPSDPQPGLSRTYHVDYTPGSAPQYDIKGQITGSPRFNPGPPVD